jgi:ribosomal-protein-alanine N-acetyltransferase
MLVSDLVAVSVIEESSYGFPWSQRVLMDCLRSNYVCRVLEHDNAILGYAIMSCGAGEAHILNVCVDPAFRHKGIGTMLVSYLLQSARLAGAESIFLEVRPSNLSALKLYESLGFKQVATRANYYPTTTGREDALVFNKVLAVQ